MTDGDVYAVASGKGGVGKTTTAINLGAAFVEAGRSVVVVDVDLGMANLADLLDVAASEPTLHDVLAGEAEIEATITDAGEFDVVLGSRDLAAFGRADPAGLGEAIAALRSQYDVVVLDGGGGLSHDVTVPLGLADGVVLVSTPTEAAITNAVKTRDLVDRLGEIEGVLVTRTGGAGEQSPAEVAERIGAPLLGSVPEDGAVQMSEREGTPLVTIDRESPAAQAYREVAYGLLDEPLPRTWGESSPDQPAGSEIDQPGKPAEHPQSGIAATIESVEASNGTASNGGAITSQSETPDDEDDDQSILSRLTGGLLG
ncbi:MinD/ParA family protein [Halodesulfurarchaeum sp. HSR-GB]|uniref:MinD/ParA family ATP-binding protein n=1 Tax=Halodesulfurarchaeum sp. HSR-GB TaxID=3074077 RepID=UPI00285701B7|nr:MinD/ParA family protein [Halodesulfurarchaeum sp. HSR-GB]MDR5656422.1 MinD/ParA family protein [Halodesulfurarchaeum sp. HSR-GB]